MLNYTFFEILIQPNVENDVFKEKNPLHAQIFVDLVCHKVARMLLKSVEKLFVAIF